MREVKNDEKRSSSPAKRGGDNLCVLPLKSVAMTGIPTSGMPNQQHGFVSRPGGAFKFRPLPTMSQSSTPNTAHRNPFQELRTLTLKNAPPTASIRRASSSHAHDVSFVARHKELAARSDGSALRRSRTPGGGVSRHAPAKQQANDVETSLLALKQLHRSLDAVSMAQVDKEDEVSQTATNATPGARAASADIDAQAHPASLFSFSTANASRPGELMENDHTKEGVLGTTRLNKMDVMRPSTSLGFSSVGDEVTHQGIDWTDEPTAYDEILPSSIGRRSASRTPQLMWLHRMAGDGAGKRVRQLPFGALSSERINAEASRVFGELADEAVEKSVSGVHKFVEARALDLRLQDALSQGKLILARPPLTEARQKYYAYIIPELFAVFDLVVDAAGPLRKLLKDLRGELHALIYTSEKDFSQSVSSEGVSMPLVQQVSELKKGHDRLLAASSTQMLLIKKADVEKEGQLEENRHLSLRVHQLEQNLKEKESSMAALQVS